MASNPTATFGIDIDTGDSASATSAVADGLEQVRVSGEQAQAALKDYSASLRSIKGKSEEAVTAKAKLKAQIDQAKNALSNASLAALKNGTSLSKLSEKTKLAKSEKEKLAKQTTSLHDKMQAVGGPIGSLSGKLGGLKEMLTGAGGGMGIAQLAALGFAAAAVAMTAAVVAGAFALGKWIAKTADARRSAGLMREAVLGNAQDAERLGGQIDNLALRVPTAKAALNDMAVSMAKGGIKGAALVDTLNAVAMSSAALGDDAGAKLREFVDRGRLTQRFAINPLELQGSGLKFDDIAQSLSKNLKVGINEARSALLQGRVRLGDGAKAMRDAVEKNFGRINLRQMLSLEVLTRKVGEAFDTFTEGVKIDGALDAFKELFSIFDQTSYTGSALKTLVTAFGTEMVSAIKGVAPLANRFIRGLVLGGLDVAITYYKVKNQLTAAFGDSKIFKNIDGLTLALNAGKLAVYGIAAGVVALGAIMAVAFAPFVGIAYAVVDIFGWLEKGYNAVAGLEWGKLGGSIVDGLIGGLKSAGTKLTGAVKNLGADIKKGFAEALGIHSPSRVMFQMGQHTTEGFRRGVEDDKSGAQEAVTSLAFPTKVPSIKAMPQQGASGGRQFTFYVNAEIIVNDAADPKAVAGEVKKTFTGDVRKALEDALLGNASPVRA